RVVEHDEPAVTEHRADGRELLIVDGRIELRRMHVRAERPTRLHGADRPTRRRASAEIEQNLAQRFAERELDEPAPLDVAGKLDRDRAARAPDAEVLVEVRTLVEDYRHARERQHVVDDRGLAE